MGLNQARRLRRNMTEAEKALWKALRSNALGVHFRRQVPIGPYVADFACLPPRLIVEVDGGQHADSAADRRRDAWFGSAGYHVLRLWNHEVLRNLDGVAATIATRCRATRP